MNTFQSKRPEDFDAIFERIGKDWMLITADDGNKANTMTASWGFCGILWNKPMAVCFIRPQRYTYPIACRAERLTLSFFEETYRKALQYCGKASGRNEDKWQGAGLTVAHTESGAAYPAEAQTVLVCRKLYEDDLKKECFLDPALFSNYPTDDFHRFFICEIEEVLEKV